MHYKQSLRLAIIQALNIHSNTRIYLCGIGGIGMSALAKILLQLNFSVAGSDMSHNHNCTAIQSMGGQIYVGHSAKNVDEGDLFVKSSAINNSNVEYMKAQQLSVNIISRAELLAIITSPLPTICISGTHGKTTVTSMITETLHRNLLHPMFACGGIINYLDTNADVGEPSDNRHLAVIEADESDASFLHFTPYIAIITNIDEDHMETYASIDSVRSAFTKFINNVQDNGAIVGYLHPDLTMIINNLDLSTRQLITYSLDSKPIKGHTHVFASNIQYNNDGTTFDLNIHQQNNNILHTPSLEIPLCGKHNLENALACIATLFFVQKEMSLNINFNHLNQFSGTYKRFTKFGNFMGHDIIMDYGHHPKEIASTLEATRQKVGSSTKIIAVFQPHKYSRFNHFLHEFVTSMQNADTVVILDIYSANEENKHKISVDDYITKFTNEYQQRKSITYVPNDAPISPTIESLAMHHDKNIIIFFGAGNIEHFANKLINNE